MAFVELIFLVMPANVLMLPTIAEPGIRGLIADIRGECRKIFSTNGNAITFCFDQAMARCLAPRSSCRSVISAVISIKITADQKMARG